MPLPATHLQSVQATVKMVNASELSLRGAKRRGNLGKAVTISPMAFLLSNQVLRDSHVASLLGMTNLFTLRH